MKGLKLLLFLNFFIFSLYAQEDIETEDAIPVPLYFVNFSGFTAFDIYVSQEKGSTQGKFIFDPHYFYFSIYGDMTEDLGFFGELEIEHVEEITTDRAFIYWRIFRNLTLRFGRFYVPVGKEIDMYQAPLRKLVTRPLPTDVLILHEWTDNGIEFIFHYPAGTPFFSLQGALVNGPNLPFKKGRQIFDNNTNKFIALRPYFNLFNSLELGSSFSTGKYDDAMSKTLSFLTFYVLYNRSPFYFISEYVSKEYDDTLSTQKIKEEGFYALFEYKFIRNFKGMNYISILLRYDYLNRNNKVSGFSLGLNFSPRPRFLIKTEYRKNIETPEIKNDMLLFSVVLSL